MGFSIFYNKKYVSDKPRKSIGSLHREDHDIEEEELEQLVEEIENDGYTVSSILPYQQKGGPVRQHRNRH